MSAIAVLGAAGRMGREVVRVLATTEGLTLVAAVDRPGSPQVGADAGLLAGVGACGVEVVALGDGAFGDAAVVIDFSLPDGLAAALSHLGERALVTGTTGVPDDVRASLGAQAGRAPVLQAANFSTGVTLLLDLVGRAARALPDARIEIVEAHHRFKVDAPSGTALALGDAAAAARGAPRETIGFHALRGGDVVGDHQVHLLLDGERIQLGHVAQSRSTFAHGAVRAARWVDGRGPGMYTMRQVLGLDAQTGVA